MLQKIDRAKNVLREPSELLDRRTELGGLHNIAQARVQTILVKIFGQPVLYSVLTHYFCFMTS